MKLVYLLFPFHFMTSASASFGQFFVLGIPAGAPRIVEFETTLQLPNAPSPPMPHGLAAIWPGMITETGDFVQSLAEVYSQDWVGTSGCHLSSVNQFCSMGYTLVDGGTKSQISDQQTEVDGNTALDIHYVWNADTNNVTSTVKHSGQVIAHMETSKLAHIAMAWTASLTQYLNEQIPVKGLSCKLVSNARVVDQPPSPP
jgi:hypothetical protein